MGLGGLAWLLTSCVHIVGSVGQIDIRGFFDEEEDDKDASKALARSEARSSLDLSCVNMPVCERVQVRTR